MAKYGSPDTVIEFDNSGGTLVDVSNYILEASEIMIEGLFEETTAFGDDWVEQTPVLIKNVQDITLSMFYDDTATTGPDALFNAVNDGPRTLKVTWGSTKTTSVETYIKSYGRQPIVKGLTKARVVLTKAPGVVTETSSVSS